MTNVPAPFIWYDLMTTDIAAASKFYGDVVGWKIADSGMPDMNYSILSAGDVMVGGLMAMPPGGEAGGLAPMWAGYIYSADVDGDAKRAAKLGGTICKEAEDIPGVGRFAAVLDPDGAMFYLFKPNSDEAQKEAPEGTPGHIGWRELRCNGLDKAWDFYSKMFNWKKEEAMDMGPLGTYQIFSAGGGRIGGIMTRGPDTPPPSWRFYFNVEAVDAAAGRVKKGGGKLTSEAMQVPGGGWIIHCLDPEGVMFALGAAKR